MDLTREDSPVPDYKYKLTTVLGGIYLFYVSELLLKLFLEGEGVKKTEEVGGCNNIISGYFMNSCMFPSDGRQV